MADADAGNIGQEVFQEAAPSGAFAVTAFGIAAGRNASTKAWTHWHLDQDLEMWVPVFRQDHAQTTSWSATTIHPEIIAL
jgi:hypothetical protein